jgi:hypothetical protein
MRRACPRNEWTDGNVLGCAQASAILVVMAHSHVGWLSSLFLLAACRTFDVEREQAFLRYRPDADVLDLVLVYDGVGAVSDSDADVSGAVSALQAIGQGGRHVLFFDWPFDFDVEKVVEDARRELQKPDSDASDIVRAFLDFESNLAFGAARFLTDEHGRLCMLQRLRIEHCSQGLRLLDRWVNLSLQRDHDDAEGHAVLEGDALLFERARRGGSWARFDGTTLEVSYPMTPEAAAKALVSLTENPSQKETPDRSLLRSLSAIYATGDELRLRFAPASDGWIAFEFADSSRSYRSAVAKKIAAPLVAPAGNLAAALRELKAQP